MTPVTPKARRVLLAGLVGLAVVVAVLLFRIGGPVRVEPPAPEAGDTSLLDPPRASSLAVPLVIPLEVLVELLEEAVPRSYGDLEERHELPGRDRTTVAFELERLPFQATADGDVARVEAVIPYSLRAYYDPPLLPEMSGSCGTDEAEERPRLRVVMEAPLTLTDDWVLSVRSRLASIEPASGEDRDRCRVTFLDVDLTEHVVDGTSAFLTRHQETLDSLARSLDLRASFSDWWETLRAPVELTDSIWLVLGPESIRRGPVGGSGDSIRVNLALDAIPRVVVGPRPREVSTGLPPLGQGSGDSGLDIVVEGRADYLTASHFLMEELAGTTLTHEGRTLRIDSLDLRGLGDGRVALELLVSGDLSGRLFLTGTPSIDGESQVISVPDLDFDVATEDVVEAAASWLQTVGLRTTLRARARWPAAPANQWLRGWLDRGLNRDISSRLRIRGTIDSLAIQEVHALSGDLRIRIGARASARLTVLP